MSLENLITTIIATVLLGGIVIAANIADRQQNVGLRRFVMVALLVLNAGILIVMGMMPILSPAAEIDVKTKLVGGIVNPTHLREVTRLSSSSAWGAFALSAVVSVLATAALFRSFRQAVTILFPRYEKAKGVPAPEFIAPPPVLTAKPGETPLFPQMLNYYTQESMVLPGPTTRPPIPYKAVTTESFGTYHREGFNPDSTVHMVALVFIIYLVGTQFVQFILGGGLEGVAQSVTGLTALDIVIGDIPLVLIPVLGVGLAMRRDWRQTLDRLGLRLPTGEGLAVAVGMTFALLFFIGVSSYIWQSLVSHQTLEEQQKASEALSANVNTILMAFVLAATAAVAEEIAFRGSMQPVFGFVPTALVFTMIHLQYTLTPASLMILVVALAFGWIRQRYSTTISMMTHFLYNFIPLAITAGASGYIMWLVHLL